MLVELFNIVVDFYLYVVLEKGFNKVFLNIPEYDCLIGLLNYYNVGGTDPAGLLLKLKKSSEA